MRGKKVMLDRDLAELYGVETGALNRAVQRNQERFPDDFMFQLTASITSSATFVNSRVTRHVQTASRLQSESYLAILSHHIHHETMACRER
jgi:hypothetical protein